MKIVIDIDGTICTEEKTFERCLAVPLPGAVESIQKLYDNGHMIILYTARGWSEYEMTVNWLQTNKVPFDQLLMGKPIADVWIDDRTEKFTDWNDIMEKLKI